MPRGKAHGKVLVASLAVIIFLVCMGPQMAWSEEPSRELLLLPPFLGRPTHASIALNVVAGERDILCYARFRKANETGLWQRTGEAAVSALSPATLSLSPLVPDAVFEYQVYARLKGESEFQKVAEQRFRTQRTRPSPFSFAMISDSHITPFHGDRVDILAQTSASVLARKPDLFLLLGDNIQTFTSHGGPMTEERFGPILYAWLRRGLGSLPSAVPAFLLNGNWEGENGWHPARERGWARQARTAFIPNPGPGTYPEGGSKDEDYFAFTWGDVLFLVLNVTGYTLSDHAMQSPVGKADDWTLGETQKAWLFKQLSSSRARWKLIFIHHTVGGNAGDEVNSRYGRGGGRAARVGEQELVHGWMGQYGAQALFYGHDHVFTDITVDGVHYVCAGSAGAPWKFGEEITGYKRYWTPSGYTWVDVGTEALTVSFVQPDPRMPEGKVLHHFQIPSKK